MRTVRVGTRGSKLALMQAGMVSDGLNAARPDWEVVLSIIKTSGDQMTGVILGPEYGQRFFTGEIEEALRRNEIDVAVHSLKDLSTKMSDGLCLGAFLPREDRSDALVTRSRVSLDELPRGARVGTSSPRRALFLREACPDLHIQGLRGNVPTRVSAVDEGALDAAILAAAGLNRLAMGARIDDLIGPETIPPAGGQGIVGVQIREGDLDILHALAVLDHEPTRIEALAERSCLRRLEAGCQAPVGVTAIRDDVGGLTVTAWLWTPQGVVQERAAGVCDRAESVGSEAAESVLRAIGLASLREAEWTLEAPSWLTV